MLFLTQITYNQFILINNPVKSIIFTRVLFMKFCARVISSYFDTNSTNSYGPSQKSVHRLLNLTHIDKQVELSLTSFPLSVFERYPLWGFLWKIYSKKTIPELRTLYIAFKEQLTLTDLRKIVKPLRTVASNRQTLRLTWLAHMFSMLRVPFQWMSRSSFLKKIQKFISSNHFIL